MTTRICDRCGCVNVENAKFCAQCGEKLPESNPWRGGTQGTTSPDAAWSQYADVHGEPIPDSFWGAVKRCYRKFFVCEGRASRTEYLWRQLYLFLSVGGAVLLAVLFSEAARRRIGTGDTTLVVGCSIALMILLINLLPSVAVLYRRAHDCNSSGFEFLLVFVISFFTLAIVLVYAFVPGTPGPNRFGPRPVRKERAAKDAALNRTGEGEGK